MGKHYVIYSDVDMTIFDTINFRSIPSIDHFNLWDCDNTARYSKGGRYGVVTNTDYFSKIDYNLLQVKDWYLSVLDILSDEIGRDDDVTFFITSTSPRNFSNFEAKKERVNALLHTFQRKFIHSGSFNYQGFFFENDGSKIKFLVDNVPKFEECLGVIDNNPEVLNEISKHTDRLYFDRSVYWSSYVDENVESLI